MKTIRNACCTLLLVAASLAQSVTASNFSTDQSDIWWNANESGWGMQFVQRGKTIFATLFVYDQNNKATFFVAALAGSKSNGQLIFTGELYATNGPWFGAPIFDPATVVGVKVGTMTYQRPLGVSGPASLSYTVNGVSVQKSVTRQFIASDDYTGPYFTAFHMATTGCAESARNVVTNDSTRATITQTSNSFTLALLDAGCTMTGTYAQTGQFGSMNGTYTCSSGDNGTVALGSMNVTPVTFTGQLTITSTAHFGCVTTGQMAGVRTDQ